MVDVEDGVDSGAITEDAVKDAEKSVVSSGGVQEGDKEWIAGGGGVGGDTPSNKWPHSVLKGRLQHMFNIAITSEKTLRRAPPLI